MKRSTYIPAERKKKIMEYIENHTSAQIRELADQFHVSEATVRRDLDALDRQGVLRRTHGGAIKTERGASCESQFTERISLMKEEKRRIAQRAAHLVRPGDTVLLDAGTTAFFIAQALTGHENMTLITNDLNIAYQTVLAPSSSLIVTGGARRTGRQDLVGSLPESFIRSMHVDVAFLCVDGLDMEGGATVADFGSVGIKQLMLQAASRSVIAADHSKLGKVALARICALSEAGLILTDSGADPQWIAQMKKLSVPVETA